MRTVSEGLWEPLKACQEEIMRRKLEKPSLLFPSAFLPWTCSAPHFVEPLMEQANQEKRPLSSYMYAANLKLYHFKTERYLTNPRCFCIFLLKLLFSFPLNAVFPNTLGTLSLITHVLNYVLRWFGRNTQQMDLKSCYWRMGRTTL